MTHPERESGTPRTDEEAFSIEYAWEHGCSPYSNDVVRASFARQLEGKLAAALKERDKAEQRAAAVEAETIERCAKVCDAMNDHGTSDDYGAGRHVGIRKCANAIRALLPERKEKA